MTSPVGKRTSAPDGRRAPARGPAAGFTLIELVVTLFVIALAAAVVGPSIGRTTDSLRARAEVAGFTAFFRRAREQAVVSGRERTVTVDPGARSLTELAGEQVRGQRTFTEHMTILPDPPAAVTVRFSPFGSSTGGSFRLAMASGVAYRVTVDALTGRVTNRREAR